MTYLLTSLIVENFKQILKQIQSYNCVSFLGPAQKGSFALKNFLEKQHNFHVPHRPFNSEKYLNC